MVVAVVLACWSSAAQAVCDAPVDTGVLCQGGRTGIVAAVVSDAPDVNGAETVVVQLIGGDPMPGIGVGDRVLLAPSEDAVVVSMHRAQDTAMFFVLRNVGTFTRAAPVIDGRVVVDEDGGDGFSINTAWDLITLDDPQSCLEQSAAQIEPQRYLGGCDDGIGCAATPASPVLAVVLCALGRRRCRCRCRRQPSATRSR